VCWVELVDEAAEHDVAGEVESVFFVGHISSYQLYLASMRGTTTLLELQKSSVKLSITWRCLSEVCRANFIMTYANPNQWQSVISHIMKVS
jgi:hypothetical protein